MYSVLKEQQRMTDTKEMFSDWIWKALEQILLNDLYSVITGRQFAENLESRPERQVIICG